MGIDTIFVIANEGMGAQVGASAHPDQHWPALRTKGVDIVKLVTLYSAIVGQEYRDGDNASLQLAGGDAQHGTWVFAFTQEVLRAYADVAPARVPAIAQTWAQTEELEHDGWSVADAQACIGALSAHARQALDGGQSMYLVLAL